MHFNIATEHCYLWLNVIPWQNKVLKVPLNSFSISFSFLTGIFKDDAVIWKCVNMQSVVGFLIFISLKGQFSLALQMKYMYVSFHLYQNYFPAPSCPYFHKSFCTSLISSKDHSCLLTIQKPQDYSSACNLQSPRLPHRILSAALCRTLARDPAGSIWSIVCTTPLPFNLVFCFSKQIINNLILSKSMERFCWKNEGCIEPMNITII